MDDQAWIPAACRHLAGLAEQDHPFRITIPPPPPSRITIPPHPCTFGVYVGVLVSASILGGCLAFFLPWQLALFCAGVVWVGISYGFRVTDCDEVCEAIRAARLADVDRTIEVEAQEFATTGQIATVAQLEQCQRHKRRARHWALGFVLVWCVIWLALWQGFHAPAPSTLPIRNGGTGMSRSLGTEEIPMTRSGVEKTMPTPQPGQRWKLIQSTGADGSPWAQEHEETPSCPSVFATIREVKDGWVRYDLGFRGDPAPFDRHGLLKDFVAKWRHCDAHERR